jgi:hypothetical protein
VRCTYPERGGFVEVYPGCCADFSTTVTKFNDGAGAYVSYGSFCGPAPGESSDPGFDEAICRSTGDLVCAWPGGTATCPALYEHTDPEHAGGEFPVHVYVTGCCGILSSDQTAPGCGVTGNCGTGPCCSEPGERDAPLAAEPDACGGACVGNTPTCAGGACVCNATSCQSNERCLGGACVPCVATADTCVAGDTCCGETATCNGGTCCLGEGDFTTACTRDADCCAGAKCRLLPDDTAAHCGPQCFADGSTVPWDGVSTLCECCNGNCTYTSDPTVHSYFCPPL